MDRGRVPFQLIFPNKGPAGLQGVFARVGRRACAYLARNVGTALAIERVRGRRRAALPRWVVSGLLVTAGAGCTGPDVDITEALQVAEVTTGWFDDGIVQGRLNRLVPTISFRLENTTDAEIRHVQVTAVFRRVGEEETWGDAFARVIGTEGLASGSVTSPIVLQSDLGYTGEEPRLDMFENRSFVDVGVELFIKHGGAQLVKFSEFQIERQLLTQ